MRRKAAKLKTRLQPAGSKGRGRQRACPPLGTSPDAALDLHLFFHQRQRAKLTSVADTVSVGLKRWRASGLESNWRSPAGCHALAAVGAHDRRRCGAGHCLPKGVRLAAARVRLHIITVDRISPATHSRLQVSSCYANSQSRVCCSLWHAVHNASRLIAERTCRLPSRVLNNVKPHRGAGWAAEDACRLCLLCQI